MWKIVSFVCGKCSLFNQASYNASILSYMNETGTHNLDITFVLSAVSSVNLCMIFAQYDNYVTCMQKKIKSPINKMTIHQEIIYFHHDTLKCPPPMLLSLS